jgi:uncharacterized protein
MEPQPEYDDRYLAGILFFNAGDFFEAHEVWEDLWHVATNPERRFYQGLIQTAVALFHLGNRNVRGAVRLYHSSRDYLAQSRPQFLGLDVEALFAAMENLFAPHLGFSPLPGQALQTPAALASTEVEATPLPQLHLDPEPAQWPDPEVFLPDEDEEDRR